MFRKESKTNNNNLVVRKLKVGDKVKKKYDVEESVLSLILGVEQMLKDPYLPVEYRKVGFEFVGKLSRMAGIKEKKYDDFKINDYKYTYEVEYQKEYK